MIIGHSAQACNQLWIKIGHNKHQPVHFEREPVRS